MKPRTEIEVALGAVAAIWGVFLVFENAYFAAPFYGVAVPIWAAWVGAFPTWSFDVIDTVAVIAIVALFVLGYYDAKHKKRRMNSRGSGGTVLAWGIALVLIAVLLYAVFGLTLSTIIQDLEGFLKGL